MIWETGEWDPVSGLDDDDDDDGDDSGEDGEDAETGKEDHHWRWVAKEIELPDGVRDVGFWIDGGEAKIRVEMR